jgi:phosphoadenosine phosphosulfate reductase
MAEPARRLDVIHTGPRFTAAAVDALNARFADVPTIAMLRTVLREGLAGDVAAVSSFGAESAVLLHLIATIDRSVPVLFLDTGKHFPETLGYRDEIMGRLGMNNLVSLAPTAEVITKRDETGLRWSYDPDGCCEIRKVQPLAAALSHFDASFTGRKGFQSATRAGLQTFELDQTDASGRLKINPLASWSSGQIRAYFDATGLSPHPLVAQGYPSIGCSPCTTRVAPGEDPRSGRWKGWDKTECGIHVDGAAAELPPGYDPAF